MSVTTITPTIGRRVWYWPNDGESPNSKDPEQPFDAGIIFVYSEGLVDLDVCDHHGQRWLKSFVPLGTVQTPGCASWMPYQVQQLEKQWSEERHSQAIGNTNVGATKLLGG